MYRAGFSGRSFFYFWLGKQKAINNDNGSRLFVNPFTVSPENAREWRETSRANMIAPETLTYWNEG